MVLGYLVMFLVGSTIIFLVMFIVSNRRRYKEMLQRKQEELLSNMDKVRLLKDTWRINEKDVKFDKKVAHGGYGVVWRGKWLQYEVAAKELFPLPSVSDEDDEFDDSEVQSMLSLRHPRIVHFHGVGRRTLTNNRRFMIFEWMSGGSLYHTLLRKQYPLPWWWRLRCAVDIAIAVEFLHRSGFAHRDLKSENVLLDSMGRCKVGDFGMTRMTRRHLQREGLRPDQKIRARGGSAIERLRSAVRMASSKRKMFELPRMGKKDGLKARGEADLEAPPTDVAAHIVHSAEMPKPHLKKHPAGDGFPQTPSTSADSNDIATSAPDPHIAAEWTLVQGSPLYLSTELFGTLLGPPRFAADVYAYGMILYELLTRHLPWKTETDKNPELDPWKEASLGNRPIIEYEKTAGVPIGFLDLIKKCWSQNPDERPTMQTVLLVLNDMVEESQNCDADGVPGSGRPLGRVCFLKTYSSLDEK